MRSPSHTQLEQHQTEPVAFPCHTNLHSSSSCDREIPTQVVQAHASDALDPAHTSKSWCLTLCRVDEFQRAEEQVHRTSHPVQPLEQSHPPEGFAVPPLMDHRAT